jgi:virginiamycin B lyase
VRGTLALIVVALTACFLCAPSAQAFIYWADTQHGTIGRANNDGSGVNDSFITGATSPDTVAVDSSHIYWGNAHSIGRAGLDGTGVNQNFVAVSGPGEEVTGIAVNGASLFWSSVGNKIGHANLDGSSPKLNFISTSTPCGVALDSGHIYWVSDALGSSYIGRAALNGSSVEGEFVTIPGASPFPCGVAVNSANIYWADWGFGGGTEIGRADIKGKSPDASLIGEASAPWGIVVDASHLFWANSGTGTIGRANTDATGVNQSFVVTGGGEIHGVAVDGLVPPPAPAPAPAPGGGGGGGGGGPSTAPPSNEIKFGKLKLNRTKGTATLAIAVKSPGALTFHGKGIRQGKQAVSSSDSATLALKPVGAAKKSLKRTGKLKLTIRVTFTPAGGTPRTTSETVSLKETRRG